MRSLKALRAEKGWTQERAAKEARIDRNTYSAIESGARKPHVSTAKKVADAFGVDVGAVINQNPTAFFEFLSAHR
jgi:DNA-binding XRE family transcriptional regulator